MDGFVEKFTQRFTTAQDMINANREAEATEVEKLQAEVRTLLDTLDEKIGELGGGTSDQALDTGKLETHIHKENVRVYRNVQAAVTDELEKQTGELKKEVGNQTAVLAGMVRSLENKQKTESEEISEISARINNIETEVKRISKRKATLSIQIIALLLIAADIALKVLSMLGIL